MPNSMEQQLLREIADDLIGAIALDTSVFDANRLLLEAAHYVRLTVSPDGIPAWTIAEPLDRVTISHDVRRGRPMLILST